MSGQPPLNESQSLRDDLPTVWVVAAKVRLAKVSPPVVLDEAGNALRLSQRWRIGRLGGGGGGGQGAKLAGKQGAAHQFQLAVSDRRLLRL
jgi:hypothetical protein